MYGELDPKAFALAGLHTGVVLYVLCLAFFYNRSVRES